MTAPTELAVTTCLCGLQAPGSVTDHPCRLLCARVPAHLAVTLGVELADVMVMAEAMPLGLYDPERRACDPGRCGVCRGRSSTGRLSARGAEAIMDLIDTKEAQQ